MTDVLIAPNENPFTLTSAGADFELLTVVSTTPAAVVLQVVEQGPPGVAGTSAVAKSAQAAEILTVGAPLRVDFLGQLYLADAATPNNSYVVGLAGATTNIGFACPVERTNLETPSWTAIVGAASLTPGATYFLSATPGMLTTTPPSTVGHTVVVIGKALSTTVMELTLSPPIML